MPSNHPKEDEKPVEPERDEPDQVMVPEILVNVENKPWLESAAPPLRLGQGWVGGGGIPDINIHGTNSLHPLI